MILKKLFVPFAIVITTISVFESCQTSPAINQAASLRPDTHLGELMGQMQYYTVKLGLSLQHKNQPLASFYMNEVNQTYQDIVDKKITNGTFNVSDMIQQLLSSSKDRMEKAITKNDTAHFEDSYRLLVNSCNNCHRETNHGFIVIQEPNEPFNGQNFGVQISPYSE